MSSEKRPQRIKTYVALLMLILAILCDGVQALTLFLDAIPPIGEGISAAASFLIDVFAATTFYIWFALLGVDYNGKNGNKRMLTMIASFTAEAIPGLDDLIPGITFGVGLTIFFTWLEDRHWLVKFLVPAAVAVGVGAVTGGVGLLAEGAAAGAAVGEMAASNTAQKLEAAKRARQSGAAKKAAQAGGVHTTTASNVSSKTPTTRKTASMPIQRQAHGQDPYGSPYYYPEAANDNDKEEYPEAA